MFNDHHPRVITILITLVTIHHPPGIPQVLADYFQVGLVVVFNLQVTPIIRYFRKGMKIIRSWLGLILTRGSISAFTLTSHNLPSLATLRSTNTNTMTTHTATAVRASSNSINAMESGPTCDSVVFEEMQFGKFKISPSQIFYNSPTNLTAAIVNLRPIVPGHVLVVPHRVVPHLSQLTDEEHDDLWRSVRIVQRALEENYGDNESGSGCGFNVAVQDGKVAGQSVPHVHVHILPRKNNDFERNDDVYDALEAWAPTEKMVQEKAEEIAKNSLNVPDDDDRIDRTMQMMEDEAMAYRSLLYRD